MSGVSSRQDEVGAGSTDVGHFLPVRVQHALGPSTAEAGLCFCPCYLMDILLSSRLCLWGRGEHNLP